MKCRSVEDKRADRDYTPNHGEGSRIPWETADPPVFTLLSGLPLYTPARQKVSPTSRHSSCAASFGFSSSLGESPVEELRRASVDSDCTHEDDGAARTPTRNAHEVDDTDVATQDQELPVVVKPKRKKFIKTDDLLLLRQVFADRPYAAANCLIIKSWDTLAEKLIGLEEFEKRESISGKSAQARFNILLEAHRSFNRASERASGTAEEYQEK